MTRNQPVRRKSNRALSYAVIVFILDLVVLVITTHHLAAAEPEKEAQGGNSGRPSERLTAG
jgi:hypothetical protein